MIINKKYLLYVPPKLYIFESASNKICATKITIINKTSYVMKFYFLTSYGCHFENGAALKSFFRYISNDYC